MNEDDVALELSIKTSDIPTWVYSFKYNLRKESSLEKKYISISLKYVLGV